MYIGLLRKTGKVCVSAGFRSHTLGASVILQEENTGCTCIQILTAADAGRNPGDLGLIDPEILGGTGDLQRMQAGIRVTLGS